MPFAFTYSRAEVGIEAPIITVEVDISQGLPQIQIIGLPEAAVKEAKDRVKAAIVNAGFRTPQRRVTVNLAPADLPKQGGRYDLAIALCILAANGDIPLLGIRNVVFLGELALDGELRAVKGVLPAAVRCKENNNQLIVPLANETEAALVDQISAFAARSLLDVVNHLHGTTSLPPVKKQQLNPIETSGRRLSDVSGQELAKRALIIAAAGGHNLLMSGPPGTVKPCLHHASSNCYHLCPKESSWKWLRFNPFPVNSVLQPQLAQKIGVFVHFGHLTTPLQPSRWLAGVTHLSRGKFHWHTEGYSFWTNYRSFLGKRWRC